eukprot:scaffold752_cov196-Chaetoceros_neogracile.AAC.8
MKFLRKHYVRLACANREEHLHDLVRFELEYGTFLLCAGGRSKTDLRHIPLTRPGVRVKLAYPGISRDPSIIPTGRSRSRRCHPGMVGTDDRPLKNVASFESRR